MVALTHSVNVSVHELVIGLHDKWVVFNRLIFYQSLIFCTLFLTSPHQIQRLSGWNCRKLPVTKYVTDDITINVVEHYLGPLGADVDHEITVKPVSWPVPSVESLWLGVKPENKMRRMKAFMSCMEVGQNPYMSNTTQVPERFILICTVLRWGRAVTDDASDKAYWTPIKFIDTMSMY